MVYTLEDFFNADKHYIESRLKQDFDSYLRSGVEGNLEGNIYNISAIYEDVGGWKSVELSGDEEVTLLNLKLIKDFYGISPVPLRIDAAIGKFIPPNENGFFKVEKCCATFLYDSKLDLITIDFYCNDLFSWQS